MTPSSRKWPRLKKHRGFQLGAVCFFSIVLLAIAAPLLTGYEPTGGDFLDKLCPSSWDHYLGCDINGTDIWTLMLYGARISLYVGFASITVSTTIGLCVGLVSGYLGGLWDLFLMRIVDVFMAFPGILIALTLTALMEPSLNNIVFAIAITGWPSVARLVRGQVLVARDLDFVGASRSLGASHLRLIIRHIFPETLSPLLVHSTFSLSGAIIVEAGLSFLGLGAPGGVPTWGGLLNQGTSVDMITYPHITLIPGCALFVLIISLNFIGDALRDVFDPRN